MCSAIGTLNVGWGGVSITQLGFGCARLFARSELRSSARLIEAALAAGIRHFDTAPSYSLGQSEEVLGEVLAAVPDATIATKVGLIPKIGEPSTLSSLYRRTLRPLLAAAPVLKSVLLRGAHTMRQQGSIPQRRTLSASEVEKSLSQSLIRLRRDCIDVFLIHEPEHLIVGDDVRVLLERLRAGGVIRSYGLAWGGAPHELTLGQVAQQRFRPTAPVEEDRPDVTRIFHGVMRGNQQSTDKPAERVAECCVRLPSCGFLFSASSPKQIREVVAAVGRRRSGALT